MGVLEKKFFFSPRGAGGGGGGGGGLPFTSCDGNSPIRHVGCKIRFAVHSKKFNSLLLTLVCIFMLYVTNQTFLYMFMS